MFDMDIRVTSALINGEAHNMKYSYNWLQSHIEDPLSSAEVLKETIIFHAFEVEDTEITPTDTIFDIKVLPDRAGDCLSHYGMAREIAGLLDLNFNDISYTLPTAEGNVVVDIQAKECLRYSAVRVDGVHVAPSPAWLVKKLEDVGQRSINTVVDATNFILLDLGQPTHAFDADKVEGKIIVRPAVEGESLVTLSGEEKVLKEGMVVIADEKKILAIAGVKGGNAAEVTSATTSVILEIASFDATSVRKTSRSLNLVTDASKRFENNLAPQMVEPARAKLAGLLSILGGGTVSAVSDYYPAPRLDRAISFTLGELQQLLGTTIVDTTVTKVLDRYGYTYEHREGFYTLDVPFWRHDITGVHDIAEEVGRAIGYDAIKAKPLPFAPVPIPNEQYEKMRVIKFYLLRQGYSEVMTYSFRKKGEIGIAYGPKDKSFLRTTLTEAMKESYELNRAHAALLGTDEVRQFEIGTVFTADTEHINIAIADSAGITEVSLDAYYEQHKDALLEIDSATEAARMLGSVSHTPFTLWSPYPFIVRDIAVWISEGQGNNLKEIVDTFAQEYCAKPARMFDTFEKDGRKSVAYRFVFQSAEKTLTDTEVELMMSPLIDAIASHGGMEIR